VFTILVSVKSFSAHKDPISKNRPPRPDPPGPPENQNVKGAGFVSSF